MIIRKTAKGKRNASRLLFSLLFGVVGIIFLLAALAETTAFVIDVDKGTPSSGAQIISDTTAAGGKAIRFGTFVAPPTTPSGPLPIPNPLKSNWTAPAGHYTLPATNVAVSSRVTVDLSAATITGSSGYLFNLKPGGHLTVKGGDLHGKFPGLVLVSVPDGSTGSVTVSGTKLTNVRSIVYSKTQGGAIDVTFTNVKATGLGDGIRATANKVYVDHCVLNGGGEPPSGFPVGIHTLDDSAGNVAVPGTYIKVYNSTITGYVTNGFQGDSILGETRTAFADIQNNILGHNTDSGGVDSKMKEVIFKNNTVYSDGNRAISSHYGTLTSSGNTIYQVAVSSAGDPGKAYQGSATLNATNDIVILAPGAFLAQASVVLKPGSGPPSTYPRVGNLTIKGAKDKNGNPVTGPIKKPTQSGGYTPTITVIP